MRPLSLLEPSPLVPAIESLEMQPTKANGREERWTCRSLEWQKGRESRRGERGLKALVDTGMHIATALAVNKLCF
jgi:hypothetical protein